MALAHDLLGAIHYFALGYVGLEAVFMVARLVNRAISQAGN